MIKFDFTDSFDAIIVLNANLPDDKFFGMMSGIPLIAADGAALSLYKMGILADKVIGDMDSFYSTNLSDKFEKSNIIFDPDQESNDFEKTLKYCKENNFENVLVVGIHGGEYEHSLNNWSVFIRYSKSLNLVLYDKKRYGISIDENIRISTEINEIISLIPNSYAKLKTENLVWELDEEYLELGKREGARNKSNGGSVGIKIIEGSILLFINDRLPFAPKKLRYK